MFSKWSANSEATGFVRSGMKAPARLFSRARINLARRGSSVIAIDYAFLHHEKYFFSLADVFHWIAGDGNDVGQLSGLQGSELVLYREQFRVGQCSGAQRIDGFHA